MTNLCEKTNIKDFISSMEVPSELVPYLGDILKYLYELGPHPIEISKLLEKINLPSTANVLDLGCGKGAIAHYLAKKCKFKVKGIDAYKPFIAYAKAKAEKEGINELVDFVCDDIKSFLNLSEKDQKNFYDLVIMVSVNRVFEDSLTKTIEKLRSAVKDSGYYIWEDVYFLDKAKNSSSYYNCDDLQETRKKLEFFGDKIIEEYLYSENEILKMNEDCLNKIEKGAGEFITKFPEMKDLVEEYVKIQKEEVKLINNNGIGIWLLKKL